MDRQKGIGNHPVVRKLIDIPLVERYINETIFRAEVSLYPSLMINLFYAGIKLFSGICYRAVWFGTLAVYYILLAVMRFALLFHVRKKRKDLILELKIYRLCGMILMVLDWALTGIIVLVVRKNSGFEYPGMLIYAMALYTFYAVITAVRNVIKFRKYGSPVVPVIKVINLTAALVSIVYIDVGCSIDCQMNLSYSIIPISDKYSMISICIPYDDNIERDLYIIRNQIIGNPELEISIAQISVAVSC